MNSDEYMMQITFSDIIGLCMIIDLKEIINQEDDKKIREHLGKASAFFSAEWNDSELEDYFKEHLNGYRVTIRDLKDHLSDGTFRYLGSELEISTALPVPKILCCKITKKRLEFRYLRGIKGIPTKFIDLDKINLEEQHKTLESFLKVSNSGIMKFLVYLTSHFNLEPVLEAKIDYGTVLSKFVKEKSLKDILHGLIPHSKPGIDFNEIGMTQGDFSFRISNREVPIILGDYGERNKTDFKPLVIVHGTSKIDLTRDSLTSCLQSFFERSQREFLSIIQ